MSTDAAGQAQATQPFFSGQPKNYYAGFNDNNGDNLKFRLSGEEEIRKFYDRLAGVTRDRNGKVISSSPQFALVNDEGLYNIAAYIEMSVGKITHLTKYQNEDRILRQQRAHCMPYLRMIVLFRKKWAVKSKDNVLYPGEKIIFESMLRANDGFENNNISQTYIVNENIDRSAAPPMGMQRPGFFSRVFGGARQ